MLIYPATRTEDCVTLSARHADDWVEGVSVIRISRTGTKWQADGSADGQPPRYADVATRIAAKNRLLHQYRQRLPGWKMWLLLATEIRVLHSVWIPPDISEWRLPFDFDRVLLMPWDQDVIELARTDSRPSRTMRPSERRAGRRKPTLTRLDGLSMAYR